MTKYYQDTDIQVSPLIDCSALSVGSRANLQQYMDYQGQETLADIVSVQRASKVGYAAILGYTTVLQTAYAAAECFPSAVSDFEEILNAVRGNLCDTIRGERRY